MAVWPYVKESLAGQTKDSLRGLESWRKRPLRGQIRTQGLSGGNGKETLGPTQIQENEVERKKRETEKGGIP